ncbi:hypothetical protein GCM10010216_54410 [Streptomyces flaveolus]|nr:hypothetical protein GCM10010216_54410 [Streptomyces flaveolus]
MAENERENIRESTLEGLDIAAERASTAAGPRSSPATCCKPRGMSRSTLDDPDAKQQVAENSEIAELWDETPSGPQWRRGIRHLRAVLAPEADPQ